ncbi:hypothetical protein [uncultured Selenomonas sp.]|uniref:hypothetical protein n=1 Tax=uncultured Selenomonas sp. TaxID=159275 RepID=UPI0025CE7A6E|nr:hypothetical protein [uncultured Selenomonas sp.]
MTNYYLYLDESGNFEEKGGAPSVVAGFLLKSRGIAPEAAQRLLNQVKTTDASFADVSTEPFHAMEDAKAGVKGLARYITALLTTFSKERGARLVCFTNQKDNVIVNSDKTYLNVFASGIYALIQTLLRETQRDMDAFQLHVLYAHRIETETLKEHDLYVRIGRDEYRQRIEERIGLLLAKLPRADRRRIAPVVLETENGAKHPPLMLADAVCFALRGGRSRFSLLQSGIIDELASLSYLVPEKATWEMLEDCFVQNRMADAILLWYGLYGKDLGRRKKSFQRTLVHYFAGADSLERSITAGIISEYFQQILSMRRYDAANELFDALMRDFFPLMEENGIRLDAMKFDLHFYRLTTATHQGNTRVSAQEIVVCRMLLKRLPKTFETLDYYLKYKLRVVEHWKNAYAFDEAVRALEQYKECMENLLGVLADVGDLGDYSAGVTSDTLGKIYGSLLQTQTFLGLHDAAHFADARAAFDSAMEQFTDERDRQREYQYRTATEIAAGAYDNARRCLCRAVAVDAEAAPDALLAAILAVTSVSGRLFALVHYAHLMDWALRDGHALGRAFYDAWQKAASGVHALFPDTEEDAYPRTTILWHFGAACAQMGERSAKNYYARAIGASLPARTNDYGTCPPNVAAALVMELDRLALLDAHQEKNLSALQKHLAAFLAQDDLPQAMRDQFAPWQDVIAPLTKETLARKRDDLLHLVRRMPVL